MRYFSNTNIFVEVFQFKTYDKSNYFIFEFQSFKARTYHLPLRISLCLCYSFGWIICNALSFVVQKNYKIVKKILWTSNVKYLYKVQVHVIYVGSSLFFFYISGGVICNYHIEKFSFIKVRPKCYSRFGLNNVLSANRFTEVDITSCFIS